MNQWQLGISKCSHRVNPTWHCKHCSVRALAHEQNDSSNQATCGKNSYFLCVGSSARVISNCNWIQEIPSIIIFHGKQSLLRSETINWKFNNYACGLFSLCYFKEGESVAQPNIVTKVKAASTFVGQNVRFENCIFSSEKILSSDYLFGIVLTKMRSASRMRVIFAFFRGKTRFG